MGPKQMTKNCSWAAWIAIFIVCVGFAAPTTAQDLIPEVRAITLADTDAPGHDLKPLFQTDFDTCKRACMADKTCTAFTFNHGAGACFPKTNAVEPAPYNGADTVLFLPRSDALLDLAGRRIKDMSQLPQRDITGAIQLASRIGFDTPTSSQDAAALSHQAAVASDLFNFGQAQRLYAQVAALTDRATDWTRYAETTLLHGHGLQRHSERRTAYGTAKDAAINGYMRADDDLVAADALQVLAKAYEQLDRGKDMIAPLRHAIRLSDNPDIARDLAAAVEKYGFRLSTVEVESDGRDPRICAVFSDALIERGQDYTPFVVTPIPNTTVEASGRQLCIGGLRHGSRYALSFREGLPAANGETLSRHVEITQYIRDRQPSVRFSGRSYVLPKGGPSQLPVVTVNAPEIKLSLRRISDRNMLRAIQDGYFARPLAPWRDRNFSAEIAEEIWTGTAETADKLNADVTTQLPLSDMTGALDPGIYALGAALPDGARDYEDIATQWFVVSDLGIATIEGRDAMTVSVRALSDAAALGGVKVSLISRANTVMASVLTNADGIAEFALAGTGGPEPHLIFAENGVEDVSFLPLNGPAFDLSDRGVAGRPTAGPIDVFLTSERGIYRAGEKVHVTALLRDASALALDDIPLTLVLERPDGVEYLRQVSDRALAGGHVFALPLGTEVPRGAWTLNAFVDPEGPALASTSVLVEDFQPERLDLTIDMADEITVQDPPLLSAEARYLFGAPAADLPLSASVTLAAKRSLDAWPGFLFGPHDAEPASRSEWIKESVQTDAEGRAALRLPLPELETEFRPASFGASVRLRDPGGRVVERNIRREIAPRQPLIGLRPLFEGTAPEGTEAGFEIVALGADGTPQTQPVEWTLNRLETQYQWYERNGDWNWEALTRRRLATRGDLMLDGPTRLDLPVDWGRYELIVETSEGAYTVGSEAFYAGWYLAQTSADTPDRLDIGLDRDSYSPGDTAAVRIMTRNAGVAIIDVLSDRLIDRQTVTLDAGETSVPLTVTNDWGTGAYVSVSLFHPLGAADSDSADRAPVRALGLTHASVDPGSKQLALAFDTPTEVTPRGPLEVTLAVDGVADGETAFVTIAAVDLGILNVTGFEAPDPSAHYFGQRKLGVDLRDIYGRLIDPRGGALGRIRSGGDGSRSNRTSPDPSEKLVSFFSGPIEVGADGRARVTLDLPAFNGTLRLMAVAWSNSAVGQATADVVVRDPIVLSASLPRFLAPGDESVLRLDIAHLSGPAGSMDLEINADGVTLGRTALPERITLEKGGRQSLELPMIAGSEGLATIDLALVTPDGRRFVQAETLPIRRNDPEIARDLRVELAAGQTLIFGDEIFADLDPATTRATLAAGSLAQLDAPGLLLALDRYPYGCTEQITSRALPLLYYQDLATAVGLEQDQDLPARITAAIDAILSNQGAEGGFGLWRPGYGDLWLDAYVTDFLAQARDAGYPVRDLAFRLALDNLQNHVNAAPGFDSGGQDIAYALLVLARQGRASITDLRYYADVKGAAFGSALARAQLGAALASYGDRVRAEEMFRLALSNLETSPAQDQGWRADYGTARRDMAGVLTLALEARSQEIDPDIFVRRIAADNRARSTQEAAWSLLAMNALRGLDQGDITIDGVAARAPLVRVLTHGNKPVSVRNNSDAPSVVTVTAYGVPDVPEPSGGSGYRIERAYFTLQGMPVDPQVLSVGTRLVTVLTVWPIADGQARLMIDDPIPAGFEIENANLLRGGDVSGLDWLTKDIHPEMTQARDDRFLAAIDWRATDPFSIAYIVRAVSPGSYHHPAAQVEDMYRASYRAQTAAGRIKIIP